VDDKVVGHSAKHTNKHGQTYVNFSMGNLSQFGDVYKVEKLIAEAVCKESLAQMYEGWSAWV